MNVVKTTLREVLGLFVDDGLFAGAIVGWLVVVWLLLPLDPANPWSGPALFAGLAATLVASAVQRARR